MTRNAKTHSRAAGSRIDRDRGPGARLAALATAASLLVLAAAACDDTTGPTVGERGILEVELVESAGASTAGPGEVTDGSIDAPDTVRVGEAFPVTVTTVGLDGCWEPVTETTSVQGLTAEVVPFDADNQTEDIACTAALEALEHPVELRFGEAGEGVIRVEGRRVVGRDGDQSEPLSLEHPVTVLP